MDKSPDRFGSVSISKYIRAGCSDCQDLCEFKRTKGVFAGQHGRLGQHHPPIIL